MVLQSTANYTGVKCNYCAIANNQKKLVEKEKNGCILRNLNNASLQLNKKSKKWLLIVMQC